MGTELKLTNDKTNRFIQVIKNTITESIYQELELPTQTFSSYLGLKTGYNYNYISNVFSEAQGTTIEQYLITQKIEYAKELLEMKGHTITVISNKLRYSSVSHFSRQFKKVTGFSPSAYKSMRQKRPFE